MSDTVKDVENFIQGADIIDVNASGPPDNLNLGEIRRIKDHSGNIQKVQVVEIRDRLTETGQHVRSFGFRKA